MSKELAQTISSQTQNCSFSFGAIHEFITLIEAEKKEFKELCYLGNGSSTLVLKAINNGKDVALKVIQCKDHAGEIESMQREYEILKGLPPSKCFMEVYGQFFVGDKQRDEDIAAGQRSDDVELARNIYFVEELELCQGNLSDLLLQSQQGKLNLTDSFKEYLAIQMLDAVNMLHQQQVTHGDIRAQNFLVEKSADNLHILKLRNLGYNSQGNLSNQSDLESAIEPFNGAKIQNISFIKDLFSLGILFLQLDNPETFFSKSLSESELAQLHEGNILEGYQINRSSLLYRIAQKLLSKQIENRKDIQSMLLMLLEKSKEYSKMPLLFSVVTKNWINSFSLEVPPISIKQQHYFKGTNEGDKLAKLLRQFNEKEKPKKQLTTELIRSALEIMFEWEEFKGEYEILGVGSSGNVVFGVENLKEQRSSVLKLSLCANKAEIIREIGLMKICQTPYIVKFFGYKFFQDKNGNEFVVYELERCKYSLMHHLELQKIQGEYSQESKQLLVLQILSAVNYLHQHNILHRNLKLNAFLIAENEHGQVVAKLSTFQHAAFLQKCFMEDTYLNDLIISKQYYPPFNCIIQEYNNESLLYFAPERWETPHPTTYQTDRYSLGLCLLLIDNYLKLTEKQLVERLQTGVSDPSEVLLNILKDETIFQLDTNTLIQSVTKQLLNVLPDQRKTLRDCISFLTSKIPDEPIQEKTLQHHGYLNCQDSTISVEFLQLLPKQVSHNSNFTNLSILSLDMNSNEIEPKTILSPLSFLTNLSSLSLKLNNCKIGDLGAQFLLNPLSDLINLTNVSLDLWGNSIGSIGSQLLLSPLSNLTNLSSLVLNLDGNPIGDIGAQSLLSPLKNITNLTSLVLNCFSCEIQQIGAQYLLQPITNLTNLHSIQLNLRDNQIGDIGAQYLLSPISNLINIVSFSIELYSNSIGNIGAESLLKPLNNLINLASLSINLDSNSIKDEGAQSLLSPLSNLLNLQSFKLSLWFNQIGDLGAQSLLTPVANLINISILSINLSNNFIRKTSAQYMLCSLSNLLKLSTFSLEIMGNQIEEQEDSVLLAPLQKLFKIKSLSLNFDDNSIGDVGVESLLVPLSNLVNLVSLSLSLRINSIGQNSKKSFLTSLANLFNLTNLSVDLSLNQIQENGAQFLLSPLAGLLNLTNLSLNLVRNQIGGTGAKLLLSPLIGLKNLQSLSLNLMGNSIGNIGARYILSPLSNLQNLSSLSLNANNNSISDEGAYYLVSLLARLINLSDLSFQLGFNSIAKQQKHILNRSLKNLKVFSYYE